MSSGLIGAKKHPTHTRKKGERNNVSIRILRRLPLTGVMTRNTRCTASLHPGIPLVTAQWLTVITRPNDGQQPVNWLRLVEGAWFACTDCWQRMAALPDLSIAPDGNADDAPAAIDLATADRPQLMAAALDSIGRLGAIMGTMDNQHRQALQQLDATYRERAALVALLAALYPSWWASTDDAEWPILMVETPTGQMSWHIHRRDLELFRHVHTYQTSPAWDGHSTPEKYARLGELVTLLAGCSTAAEVGQPTDDDTAGHDAVQWSRSVPLGAISGKAVG